MTGKFLNANKFPGVVRMGEEAPQNVVQSAPMAVIGISQQDIDAARARAGI